MRIQVRKWDSAFFQINIGEVFIDNSKKVDELENSSYDMILASSEKEFELNIPGYKNSYEGSLVLYQKNIKAFSEYDDTGIKTLREGDSFDKEELYELAYESGKFSRFNLDSNFSTQAFENLYRKWVENSLNATIADEVIIYEDRGGILGFITYKIQHRSCNIGLLGIKPGEQGKGIGGSLLASVENKIFYRGIKKVKVKTQQENLPAINFYEAKKFREKRKNFIKHYWKK